MSLLDISTAVLALAFGYLLGAVPTAYVIARWVRGIDIRTHGSGNVGASNIGRHLGKGYGVLVGVADALVKGVAPVLVVRAMGHDMTYQALAGIGSIAGHNWSIYLKFSGGRGMSVILGSLLVLAWKEFIALIVVALLGWAIFRSIALWMGIGLALLPLWALLFREPAEIVVYTVVALVLAILKRLLSNPGSELPGLRWRDKVLPRLLYDRDIMEKSRWVERSPNQGENGE